MSHKYPKWIDEYAESWHNAFLNMVPCSWGPIDGFALVAALEGTFLEKAYQAIQSIKKQNLPVEKIIGSFSTLSTLRLQIFWLTLEYQNSKIKDKQKFKEIIDFFIKLLKFAAKKDIFGYQSNIYHSEKEVKNLLAEIKWQKGSAEIARQLGKLYNGLISLVFSLYGDLVPQDSSEIYGPYDVSKKFGDKAILLIKDFPKIRPVELWPEIKRLKHTRVNIYQIYKGLDFKCEIAGMHPIYKGDAIKSLRYYSVFIDGKTLNSIKQISSSANYFARIAAEQSLAYGNLSKNQKAAKNKMLYWLCYQFIDFFKLAKMDWRPTPQMYEAIKDKKFASRFELNKFPPYKEYISSPKYEVYWLKDLYK